MFGNLVNNKQLLELCQSNVVSIKPFDEKLLKAVHYPLFVRAVLARDAKGGWRRAHSFDEDKKPFVLEPQQYVLAEIRESILLKEGIVGQFIPASNLIEAGLGLTAGRLEYPFGQRGEAIRFGLCNLLSTPNEVKPFQKIAYIQFFDLRGLASRYIIITQGELDFMAQRISDARKAHAQDGGPFYPDEGSSYEIDTTKR